MALIDLDDPIVKREKEEQKVFLEEPTLGFPFKEAENKSKSEVDELLGVLDTFSKETKKYEK